MILPGEEFSHYKILSAIGAGGMGEVFLAQDTRLDRQIALKVLLAEFAADDDRVRRFEQEARAASALNHPNILTIFDIGTVEGHQYIATELIKGETLRDRMEREPLKLLEAFGILLQVSAALAAAHEAGIIHRDIKPENVMIRNDGLVKVLDFGLAKLSATETASSVNTTLHQINTNPGTLLGTVAYMSPEQARGKPLDPRSDIFSLGIMMFEIFAGKRPFEGEGHLDLISSILKDEPPALRQVAPQLPRHLERIVGKALRKDRDHRYQHIRDLQIDLEDLRDEIAFENKLKSSDTKQVGPGVDTDGLLTQATGTRQALTASISTTRRFTILHAMLFVIVAAGLMAAIWYLRSGTGSPSAVGTYKTTDIATWNSAPGELFSNAAFSPDGKMIAFSSTKSGTKNIWVTQTGSTEAIQITNDAFSNIDPIWSPKGDEIAYFSDRTGASTPEVTGVWRVSALGGTPRFVAPLPSRSIILRRWTASGKIYYQFSGELYAIDVSNGSTQKVTSVGQTGDSWITVSPDERAIAYVQQDKDKWRIVTADLANTSPAEMANGKGTVDGIVWLPEKKKLFYGEAVDGVMQVFVTVPASGRATRITAADTDVSPVDAAPEGNAVIVSSAKEESNLWRVNVGDGQETPIARDLNAKLWPSVAPDGSRIVFQSIKNLSQGNHLLDSPIVVKAARSADSDRPTTLVEHGYLPAFSPDGTTVAYIRKLENSQELFIVNSNGGPEKQLTTDGISAVGYSVSPYNLASGAPFAWSADGRHIAYVSGRGGTTNVRVVDAMNGQPVAVPESDPPNTYLVAPVWSRSGDAVALAFEKKGAGPDEKPTRGVAILDVRSAQVTFLTSGTGIIRLIGWGPDDSSLIVAEASKQSGLPPEITLRNISVAAGASKEIAVLKNSYFYNISLSNDRRYLAFAARNDSRDDIWTIPVTGGQAKKITNNNDSALYYSRLAWYPDGSAIAFGKQTRYSLLSLITDWGQ